MPDWSYRTVLRPLLLSLGAERARRLATTTLRTLSQAPLGLRAIDFLGHMRADDRLRTRVGDRELAAPMALGALIDPAGDAIGAFARFGTGMIEVGPVAERGNDAAPRWRVDLQARTVAATSGQRVVGLEEVARNLERAPAEVAVCVRIAEASPDAIARIVARLEGKAAMFSIDGSDAATLRARLAAAAGSHPILLSLAADAKDADALAHEAMRAGAAGVWIRGSLQNVEERVRTMRAALPAGAVIVAAAGTEPEDVRRLLESGADVVAVDEGLICSGPGLIKRCNEALLSDRVPPGEPEPLTLDAARRSWFWGFLLGIAMFAGGLLALVIASTRVVLPYDESMCGMTREQLATLNPRLLPFMAHDRVSLAGTMLSIGIFYAALAWFGIRRGAHWAQVTLIVSATVGFFSFFFFLGFGYFDPFHAFVTAILTQFTLLCLVMQPSPALPVVPEWRESAAWRRGMWGQLVFIAIGVVLTGAGCVISFIGMTSVFVATDLEFMRTTAAQLALSYDRLVPLVAHDRASLGGMLIANGVTVWLAAQWGFRAGQRWLWNALAWGGNLAFASATIVHLVVGYDHFLHLAPALAGWVAWIVGLALTRQWMAGRNTSDPRFVESAACSTALKT
jgi:dihydroorotate dehydrogenase